MGSTCIFLSLSLSSFSFFSLFSLGSLLPSLDPLSFLFFKVVSDLDGDGFIDILLVDRFLSFLFSHFPLFFFPPFLFSLSFIPFFTKNISNSNSNVACFSAAGHEVSLLSLFSLSHISLISFNPLFTKFFSLFSPFSSSLSLDMDQQNVRISR